MTPVLELTFREVGGSPWEGRASVRFQGEPSEPFAVREGISGDQRKDIRWYVEEYMDFPEGGNATRAERIERELADYGWDLWQGLQGGGQGAVLQQWLGAVQLSGSGRLELRAADPRDEIAFRSPWELMREGNTTSGAGTLLHQLNVDVVRRVTANLPRLKLADTSDGLRVLTIVCRPDDAGFLDPRYAPEAILEALDDRPEVSVDFCRPGTLAVLTDVMQRAADDGKPYHVVHFDGHGTYLTTEGGVGVLCFEKADGQMDLVRATRFGDLMARFRVPLVVLEACRTSAKFFAHDTLASALLRQGVGTVVAMSHSVHIDMTRLLMEGFYGAIARGQPLGPALQAGRNQVLASPSRRMGAGPDAPQVELEDWFVPQLYQGGEDPVLLSKKPSRRKAKPAPMCVGFPPAPRAGFQGRGRELHRLERAVLKHPAVVVHAPGGMGKTALAREAAQWWTRTGMFPDGAVFLSFERIASPEALLAALGEALEGVEFHKRDDKEQWLSEQLAKRRMLLVWDNYESALPKFAGGDATPPEYARWAEEWTRGNTRILLTCRDPEVGLDAWPFALGELSLPEGLTLLVRFLERLGIDRQQRQKRGITVEALEPIVEQTAGHPLALELLTPLIKKLGPKPVADELGPLLAAAEQKHPEDRNRSMRASLDFSMRHLSAEARAALPAVALLAGGCMENMGHMVAGLEEEDWLRVREELERTGLVRVDGPLLKPHPVLADAEGLAPSDELAERFIAVILSLCGGFDKLVRTADAKLALGVMAACEVVVRRAIDAALQHSNVQQAAFIADSLKLFLERSGRGGEGARLVAEVHRRAGLDDERELTEVATALARQTAEARAASDAEGAARQLETLLERLDAVESWDTRFQRALTLMTLGEVHDDFRRRPADALDPLRQAAVLFETLEKEGQAGTANRAAALGDLANALGALSRFDEAIEAAEEGLALDKKRGDSLAAARGLGQIASIFAGQGRFQEAEARYAEALETAKTAGDDEFVGTISQHLGIMALDRGRTEEAAAHLRDALAACQRAGNESGQMEVFNSLGTVDGMRGNFEAALAWHEQSLKLATKLGDVNGQATNRTNRAIVLCSRPKRPAIRGLRPRPVGCLPRPSPRNARPYGFMNGWASPPVSPRLTPTWAIDFDRPDNSRRPRRTPKRPWPSVRGSAIRRLGRLLGFSNRSPKSEATRTRPSIGGGRRWPGRRPKSLPGRRRCRRRRSSNYCNSP